MEKIWNTMLKYFVIFYWLNPEKFTNRMCVINFRQKKEKVLTLKSVGVGLF